MPARPACTCDSPADHEHRAWCATQHQHPGPDCPGLCEPAEIRTEYGVRLRMEGSSAVTESACVSRKHAERRVELHAEKLRDIPGWRGRAELIQRTVTVGPWTAIPAEESA